MILRVSTWFDVKGKVVDLFLELSKVENMCPCLCLLTHSLDVAAFCSE